MAVEGLLGELTGRGREFYLEKSKTISGTEALTVVLESHRDDEAPLDPSSIADGLRRRIGVALGVRVVAPGTTAEHTGIISLPKAKRLVDLTR
jgi:hypothetical protein